MDRADGAAAPAAITVEVIWPAAPHDVERRTLSLPAGATVRDALRASGLVAPEAIDSGQVDVGVWMRPCALEQPLRERDRVELYRPLQVDPKEARRLRYKAHLEKAAARGVRPLRGGR